MQHISTHQSFSRAASSLRTRSVITDSLSTAESFSTIISNSNARAESLRGATPKPFSGMLVKQPRHGHLLSRSRLRFFKLTENAIEWYETPEPSCPLKGRLLVSGASIERTGDDELCFTASDGEQLVLRGDNLERWEERLRTAAAKRGLRLFRTPVRQDVRVDPTAASRRRVGSLANSRPSYGAVRSAAAIRVVG